MSRTIQYVYKKEHKELLFSYQQFRNIHEAVADAEGIDLTEFLKMELQVEAVSDTKAVRDYRDNYFRKLGFGKITLKPKENRPIGKK
ncbi:MULTISPECIES: DUF2960 family protein [Vibrio]|uniref:DUF2960 domain-containing protein n=1 Tax=Vibrio ezurae NBRC 102218 TaxID=1219080 RepID=U3B283_9VIBR|nr:MULTISPECIES: DUF2960 family protein [Vibrio]MPW36514.1 DUF2960 family protein [Vibrio sp. B1Z05]GAD79552.1 hypothetical protein VEZ01S_17_00390 [Vibrio ezurae NBRC 102218]